MPNQFMGWWSSVGCDSFRDETYGDVKTSGNNMRGRIVQGETYWDVTDRDVTSFNPGAAAWRLTNFVEDIPANLSLACQ
jgi:hypothetical protein